MQIVGRKAVSEAEQYKSKDEDLTTLGRDEVDGVVDAVFVTVGGKNVLSMQDTLYVQLSLLI